MQDSNQPAFPVTEDHGVNSAFPGITIRDYFAAKAMQASISGHFAYHGLGSYWSPDDIARYAYDCADAMLEARQGE
jgi:hypothetical protein